MATATSTKTLVPAVAVAQRTVSGLLYLVSALLGVAAFVAPFLLPQLLALSGPAAGQPQRVEAPMLTGLLLALSVAILLVEVQGSAISAKVVASLGVLVAVTAVLRFIEVAFPGPGGLSPIFAPIILAGFVFGARFGFLMGTMTLLVSALITGGVGPWLPYQMFAAGWVGMTAGWLPHLPGERRQLWLLAGFGFIWGILFGVILNLYFWPFVADGGALSWQPGLGWRQSLQRYLSFYVATSLVWDLGRGLGNAALIGLLGLPALRTLARFRRRLAFRVG